MTLSLAMPSRQLHLARVALLVCLLSGCEASKELPALHHDAADLVSDGSAQPAQEVLPSRILESDVPPTASDGPIVFSEVTRESGISFAYSNGRSAREYAIVESLGGGVGILDFDSDGRLDVMFAGGGTLDNKTVSSQPCGLFQNLGQWAFGDITRRAHAEAADYFTHGVFPADFNGDGFEDVAISGYGGVQMLANMGDGTFIALPPLVTNAGNSWSSSLAWADLDEHGHVVELDSDDQYGLSMLGWLALLAGKNGEAAEYYQQADEIEPFNSKLNYLWGTSLMRSGQAAQARERFDVAVRSDPRNLDAQRSLALVCLQLGQEQAAALAAETAVRLTGHQNLTDLMILAEAHLALGETDIVRSVVELALAAAQGEPQSISEIRRWCVENRIELPR